MTYRHQQQSTISKREKQTSKSKCKMRKQETTNKYEKRKKQHKKNNKHNKQKKGIFPLIK